MVEEQIEQIQTAIRGCKPRAEKLYLSDFEIKRTDEGNPRKLPVQMGIKWKFKPVTGRKALCHILKWMIARVFHIHELVRQSQASKILAEICALRKPKRLSHNGVDGIKYIWKMDVIYELAWRLLSGGSNILFRLANYLFGISLESPVWWLDQLSLAIFGVFNDIKFKKHSITTKKSKR
jgi:hypothetical protein